MERVTNNLEDTFLLANEFVKNLAPRGESAVVVALYGDLGSGKTSFVQGAAKALGIDATIISPTFVIERVYPVRTNGRKRPTSNGTSKLTLQQGLEQSHKEFECFIHIDCYRIDASKEIALLGWDEKVANPRNVIFVEWAERIGEILPKDAIRIYFEHEGETARRIKISNSPNF